MRSKNLKIVLLGGVILIVVAAVAYFSTMPNPAQDRYLDHTPPPGPNARPDPPNPDKVKHLPKAAPAG